MKFRIIILLFCFQNSIFSNGYIAYYKITNEAEWCYDNNESEKAVRLFEKAFKIVKLPKQKDVWLYCVLLYNNNESKQAFKFLKKNMKAYGGISQNIEPLLKKDGITFSERQIKKLNAIATDTANAKYSQNSSTNRIIDSLYNADQKIRKHGVDLDSIWWQNNSDSSYINFWEKLNEIDSSNFIVIKKLLRQDKLQKNNLIDYRFSTLLLHMIFERFIQIEDALLEMIDNGVLDPWEYARSKDRAYTSIGKCIEYFAYPYANSNLNCRSYQDILISRHKIGLSIYYSRPSFNYYIRPRRMMKYPLKEFYMAKIK